MSYFNKPPKKEEIRELIADKDFEAVKRINHEGLCLIKEFEGFYRDPYLCSAGVPTIGYGTTKYPDGRQVSLKDESCTLLQATEWLQHELQEKENTISDWLERHEIRLTSNQFSALVSFAYNLGCGHILESGRSLNKALLSCDKRAVAKAMRLYCKARVNGKLTKLRGLLRRRNAEAKLFLS